MSARRSDGISDVVVLVAIAAALSVVALVWLWGGIAGSVFGDGWPHVGAGGLLGVLTRLPKHLGDPAAAWPPPARSGLPGPGGFYAALGMLASAAAALGLGGARTRMLTRR